MRVRILGSAAGGGFPQWNCACANCRGLRAGTFAGKARTQTQVAVSADGMSWFLLGASPDLRTQIEAAPDLHPVVETKGSGVRQSPVSGVVLTNADLDHVLGLLTLRELQPLRVHSTDSVRRILTEDNSMFAMLRRAPGQLSWTEFAPGSTFALCDPAGHESGLHCRTLVLGTHYPAYVSEKRRGELDASEASLGLIVEGESGGRLACLPAVPRIDDSLRAELESADVILFDGTFWSDNELIRIQGHDAQTALQMGHVPVAGETGSLRRLAGLRQARKIYLHINNTNPMLDEAGPEYRQVREAGWEIAEDGWRFDL